jgi:UDP-N-acetylglucosamine 3-dehydrogenase
MRVLLIGFGNMGKNHYRVMTKLLQTEKHTLAICDPNYDNVAYKDYKKAIDEFQPNHVVIAAPTKLHEEILDYCVDKKIKKIFVEKPITETAESAKKYLDVKDSQIMVGHIERYNPVVFVLKKLLLDKEIDTIICTRSGLIKEEEDYDVDIDLSIHDVDVCQYLTKDLEHVNYDYLGARLASNVFDGLLKINGVICYVHADNKSPFKRREIKVMGPGYICEADYINQTIVHNGEQIFVTKCEPLKEELQHFFFGKITKQDLKESIKNLQILQK